jgi:hypothetical protein
VRCITPLVQTRHAHAVIDPAVAFSATGIYRPEGPALRLKTSLTGVAIPGLIAGAIYVVIALATRASTAASIIGGIVVAVIAIAIGFIFRSVFKRRAESRRE